MKIHNWLNKNLSTILTGIGAAGFVTTILFASRDAIKAGWAIDGAEEAKANDYILKHGEDEFYERACAGEDITKLTIPETIRATWKVYIPTITMGVASLTCFLGANALSKNQQASLASAYAALASAFEGYRNKAELLTGPGTNAMIAKMTRQEEKERYENRPPWDEIQTFYIDGQDQFFERTMEEVMRAEYLLNRNFILNGAVTLNEFFAFLDLPQTEDGGIVGWDQVDGKIFYGYQWIDFVHRYYFTQDEVAVCAIDMPFEPHLLGESADYESSAFEVR